VMMTCVVGGGVENKHSTDVESTNGLIHRGYSDQARDRCRIFPFPPCVCMSIHPEVMLACRPISARARVLNDPAAWRSSKRSSRARARCGGRTSSLWRTSRCT
jgi:hypothetical protein